MNKANKKLKVLHIKFICMAFFIILMTALLLWMIRNISIINIHIIDITILAEGIIIYIIIYVFENSRKHLLLNHFWLEELEKKCNVWSQYSWIDEREGSPLYIYWEQAGEIGFIKKQWNEGITFGHSSTIHYTAVYSYESGEVVKIKIFKAQIPSKANFVIDRTIAPELWKILYDNEKKCGNALSSKGIQLDEDSIMKGAQKAFSRCSWHQQKRDIQGIGVNEISISTKDEIFQHTEL